MKRTVLIEALEKLFPAVSTKPLVPETGDFRIKDRVLRSSNGQTMVQVTLPEPTGIDCRVPAALPYKLLQAAGTDDVTLALDGSDLTIKYGRGKAKYAAQLTGGVLDALPFDVAEWLPLPEGLLAGLGKCRFAVSKDASRGAICGIWLAGSHVVSTDTYRIASFQTKAPIWPAGVEGAIISTELADLVLHYQSKVNGWARAGDVIYFRAGDDTIFGGKTVPGPYPDVDTWLAGATKATGVALFPPGSRESLKRHLDQQADRVALDKEVAIEFKDKTLTISSGDNARYALEELLDLAEAAAPLRFKAHPAVLGDILTRTNKMTYPPGAESTFVVFQTDEGLTYMATVERT